MLGDVGSVVDLHDAIEVVSALTLQGVEQGVVAHDEVGLVVVAVSGIVDLAVHNLEVLAFDAADEHVHQLLIGVEGIDQTGSAFGLLSIHGDADAGLGQGGGHDPAGGVLNAHQRMAGVAGLDGFHTVLRLVEVGEGDVLLEELVAVGVDQSGIRPDPAVVTPGLGALQLVHIGGMIQDPAHVAFGIGEDLAIAVAQGVPLNQGVPAVAGEQVVGADGLAGALGDGPHAGALVLLADSAQDLLEVGPLAHVLSLLGKAHLFQDVAAHDDVGVGHVAAQGGQAVQAVAILIGNLIILGQLHGLGGVLIEQAADLHQHVLADQTAHAVAEAQGHHVHALAAGEGQLNLLHPVADGEVNQGGLQAVLGADVLVDGLLDPLAVVGAGHTKVKHVHDQIGVVLGIPGLGLGVCLGLVSLGRLVGLCGLIGLGRLRGSGLVSAAGSGLALGAGGEQGAQKRSHQNQGKKHFQFLHGCSSISLFFQRIYFIGNEIAFQAYLTIMLTKLFALNLLIITNVDCIQCSGILCVFPVAEGETL